MENPVKYMQQKDAKAAKTLQETGGLGTVATRADIIDKLFGSYLVEKKENEIFITSKAKQLLALVPEDLKKPELTAEWESRLSAIAKGKASDRKFMREIATYTKELMKQIQNGTGTFRHDNLTNKICPECGKRLLLVNGKQVNIPSYLVKAGDVIEIKEKHKDCQRYKDILEVTGGRLVPAWLDIDQEALKGEVKALPTREEIDVPVNEMLIVELYSK